MRLSLYYLQSLSLEKHEEGRRFLSLVGDLLTAPEVRVLEEYRHHMSVNRLQHVISVAYLAYRICLEKGLSHGQIREVCAAALLHDLFYFDDLRGEKPPRAWRSHPAIAWNNARQHFDFTLLGEDIICRHMWPLTRRLPRTREGRIVMWADKYCAWREFLSSLRPPYIKRKDVQP
jgi:uncharacterized protein